MKQHELWAFHSKFNTNEWSVRKSMNDVTIIITTLNGSPLGIEFLRMKKDADKIPKKTLMHFIMCLDMKQMQRGENKKD